MSVVADQKIFAAFGRPTQAMTFPERHAGKLLALILLVALLARVGAFVALESWKHPSAMEHRSIAVALLNGEGFSFGDFEYFGPSSVQSPTYPLLLAGLYRLFGTGTDLAHIVAMSINCLFGMLSAYVTYRMVLALRGGYAPALLGAALVAVWPTQLYAVTVVQAVAIIICATAAMIWLFYESIDSRRLGPWIAYSAIACLASLTEPVLLPFAALSGLLILFWRGLSLSIRIRNATVLFAFAMLILAPWSYRNYLVHGEFVPVKNTFWVNVWKGNNPNATGTDRVTMTDELRRTLPTLTEAQRRDPAFDTLRQYDLLTPTQRAQLRGKSEVEREKIFASFTKQWIRDNPAEFVRMCVKRFVLTAWYEWNNPKSSIPYIVSRTIVLIGTLVGLVFAVIHRWRLVVPVLIFGTGLLTYTLTVTAARFAFPYEPWQLGLLALGLCVLASKLRLIPRDWVSHPRARGSE